MEEAAIERSPLRELLINILSSYLSLLCVCMGLIAGWMYIFLRLPPPAPSSDLEAVIRGAELILVPYLVFYAWPFTLILLAVWGAGLFALKKYSIRNKIVPLIGWSRLWIWIMGLSLTATIIGEMSVFLLWK